jgi:hypothetical protein
MGNSGTGLWQGFDFSWANTPHRVHRLGSWLDGVTEGDGPIRGRCESRFSVGRVPDAGLVKTHVRGIRSRALRFQEGSVTAVLGATNGEAAELDGERINISVHGDATVVLRGFQLVCTSHDRGIHPQGFGVHLRRIVAGEGVLSFTPHFFVHAANSPDVVTGWRGDFRFEVEAMYTVVSGCRGEVAFGHASAAEACATIDHRRRERPVATARVAGHPGRYPHGVLGLRGFRWEQRHASWQGRNGRFLRRLEAHLGDRNYDPADGMMAFHPRMNFSNDGLIPYPVRARHQLWSTLIQYRDDRPGLAPVEIAHRIATGVGVGAEGRSLFELCAPEEGETRESS